MSLALKQLLSSYMPSAKNTANVKLFGVKWTTILSYNNLDMCAA